jgi:hypothetical protein
MPIVDKLDQELNEIVQTQEPSHEDELPEKYRGKSVTDIVRMHQEAEKVIGRQGSEVRELRQLADEHIKANLEALKRKDETAEEPDFFVDPKKAVAKIVDSNPELVALREKTRALEMAQNRRILEDKHPDYKDVLGSAEFQEWVNGSKYRQQLLRQADASWDYEAADELFGTFKELHKSTKKAEEVRSEARKLASVPSGAGGNQHAEVDADRRKVYRRADIIRLQQTDPRRYAALANEIYQAYAEGRVR